MRGGGILLHLVHFACGLRVRVLPEPGSNVSGCNFHLTCVGVQHMVPAFMKFCSPHELEYKQVRHLGVWEPHETWVILNSLRAEPKAQLMDIGARSGWFAMLGATRGHDVIAVEANENATCVIAHNAARNNVSSRVAIVNNGADTKQRELRLSGLTLHESTAEHTITDDEKRFTSTVQVVQTIRLDALEPLVKSSTLIVKLDIEGFECEALVGAAALFRRVRIATLTMEWDGGSAARARRCDWDEAVRPLREQGLQPYHTRDLRYRGAAAPSVPFPGSAERQPITTLAWQTPREGSAGRPPPDRVT